MPTIHVYLPDAVYEKLKKYAAERGVQVTNLVKLIVIHWLKRLEEGEEEPLLEAPGVEARRARQKSGQSDAVLEKLMQLQMQLEKLKEAMEERMIELEEQIFTLQDELRKLKAKVNKLEDAYEDLVHPVEVEAKIPR